MEYLIALLVIIGLYFVIPCKLSDLISKAKCDEGDIEIDAGEYSGVKPTKRKTRKKTAKAVVAKKVTKKKVTKKKAVKRKPKK